MSSYPISFPLYHVDSRKNNQEFITAQKMRDHYEEGDWAGSGIYFWDNLGNSHYWVNNHNRKQLDKTILKVQLVSNQECLLDLTEPESGRNFEHLVAILRRFFKRDFDGSDDTQKGAIINSVYRVLNLAQKKGITGFSRPFKVVKLIGLYPNQKELGMFEISGEKKKLPYATLKAKTIYAVRDQSVLERPMLLEIKEVE